MIESNTICGIAIGLIFTVIFGLTFYTMYANLIIEHWLPQTIIAGIIITSLAASIGSFNDNSSKVKKSIENTITANYDNVYMYHNDETGKFFVSDTSKYTFNYDEKTDTLIVFDNSSDVDAVFVDGVKQDANQQKKG